MGIRKIMIRDGDEFMRMCTKKLLVENGFDTVDADDGIEAIWESQPELGLMDISTTDMVGRATLKQI